MSLSASSACMLPTTPHTQPSTPASPQCRHAARGRWLRKQATVARAAEVRRENRDLAFEFENAAENKRALREHGGIVVEIARGKIIRAVDEKHS